MSESDQPQELTKPAPAGSPYTPGKLFAVSVIGAGLALVAYYAFQQLEPDQRKRLKGTAFRGVKHQIRGWIGDGEEASEA